jgi:hypothetical protein
VALDAKADALILLWLVLLFRTSVTHTALAASSRSR